MPSEASQLTADELRVEQKLRVIIVIEKIEGLKDIRAIDRRRVIDCGTHPYCVIKFPDGFDQSQTPACWNGGTDARWNHSDSFIWEKEQGSLIQFTVLHHSIGGLNPVCGSGSLDLECLPTQWSGQVAVHGPQGESSLHVSLRFMACPRRLTLLPEKDEITDPDECQLENRGANARITLRHLKVYGNKGKSIFPGRSAYAKIRFKNATSELVTGELQKTSQPEIHVWNYEGTLAYGGETCLDISLYNKTDDQLIATGSVPPEGEVECLMHGFEGYIPMRAFERPGFALLRVGIEWGGPKPQTE